MLSLSPRSLQDWAAPPASMSSSHTQAQRLPSTVMRNKGTASHKMTAQQFTLICPGSTLSLAPAERPCPPHAVLCSTTARSTLCQAQCWEHQLPRRWLLAMPKPYWWCPVTGHASLHLRVLQRLLSWSETSFHNSHPADSFNTSQFRHHLLQEVSGDWMRFPLILVSSLSVIPPLSSGASEDETRPDSSWHLLSLAHQHPQYLPLEGNSTKRCPRPALPQRPAHHLSIGRWCQ